MGDSSTESILAEVSRFGADLQDLQRLLDLPHADVQQHVRTLHSSFLSLQSSIASDLEARDRIAARVDVAADEIQKLRAQVMAMEGTLRALQARIDQLDRSGDRFAGRH